MSSPAAPPARFDDLDMHLIDALQVSPRATWTEVGRALDVAPITAARRWSRLTQQGVAWVNVALGEDAPMVVTVVQLRCRPGAATRVCEGLVRLPQVVTVQLTTGEFDIMTIVLAPTFEDLADLLHRRLGGGEFVTAMRSQVCTQIFGGYHWRLGALAPGQLAMIGGPGGDPASPDVPPLNTQDRTLLRLLSIDGRASLAELSARTEIPVQSVRRRIGALERSRQLRFRCDLVRPLAGWSLMLLVRLRTPVASVQADGAVLRQWEQTRFCAAVVNVDNLVVVFGFRSFAEMHAIDLRLATELAHATVTERSLIPQQYKVHGRVFGQGRARSTVVPIDPWGERHAA